jgi:hypothetical protein
MELITSEPNTCLRCSYCWRPQECRNQTPRKCPRCHSVLWNREALSRRKKITADAIAKRIERERVEEATVRKSRAHHEALNFFASVGQNGETVESLRAQIAVSEAGLISLRDLFGPHFAREVERGRQEVLEAFDQLAASPPQGFAERTERKREFLLTQYRPVKEMVARRAVRGDDPWNF